MKIAVIGYSGSGKSTLAKRLAAQIGCRPFYLDAVQFVENWGLRDRGEALLLVRAEMDKPVWVIDGNYSGFFWEERLAAADEIVWLCYPRLVCLARAIRRHRTYRGKVRESIAEGCLEKLDWEFVRWILHDGRNKRRVEGFRNVVRRYPHKTVVIRNDRALRAYLRGKGLLDAIERGGS